MSAANAQPDASAEPPLMRPGPGSVAWRVHRERAMLLSWGRAILLQLAHPLVATGVAQHSSFGASPVDNRRRLHRTVQAMLDLTFGQPVQASATGQRIDQIHGRVVGQLDQATGAWPSGTTYAARDPQLLLWVYATMLDSSLLVYERYIGPLTPAEQDAYCQESRAIGPLLGLPVSLIPASRAALTDYMAGMYASGQVAVGDTARQLMAELLQARPFFFVRGPLLTLLHLPTIGLLPPEIRAAYRLPWTPLHSTLLASSSLSLRLLLPIVPPVLRCWPIARQAVSAGRMTAAD